MTKAGNPQADGIAAQGVRERDGFRPEHGFGTSYRRFFDLDLDQSFAWLEHADQRLAVQRFEPPRMIHGSAVVVHGYYDHVGLYGHLIRYLLGRGLRVLAYDQQGHGLSTGEPATINDFGTYATALAAVTQAHAEELPQPCWLVGQSMGGSVILQLLDQATPGQLPHFGPIVLLAPLVRPASWQWARLNYAIGRHFAKQVERKFVANTENAEFSALLQADPLQARILPVQWVTAMMNWKRDFERRPPHGRRVHVVQGNQDKTVDGPYNVGVLKRRYDVSLLELPDARHHLVNERASVRERIWQYLDGIDSGA